MAFALQRRMAARQDPYVRRVVIAVGTAAVAVLLVLAVWASLHMLLLIFGGILLAVLLRGARRDAEPLHAASGSAGRCGSSSPRSRRSSASAGWYLVRGDRRASSTSSGSSLTALWDAAARATSSSTAGGSEVLAHARRSSRPTAEKARRRSRKLRRGVLGGVSGLVISVIIGLYVAADPTLYRRGFLRLVPMRFRDRTARDPRRAARHAALVAHRHVRADDHRRHDDDARAVGCSAFRIALALGIIAFCLEFVPYVGPILAAIPAILIASTSAAAKSCSWCCCTGRSSRSKATCSRRSSIQRSVHIPPMLTISAQVVLGTLLGVVGVIFATPLTACAMVLVQRLYVEDALGDELERQRAADQRMDRRRPRRAAHVARRSSERR